MALSGGQKLLLIAGGGGALALAVFAGRKQIKAGLTMLYSEAGKLPFRAALLKLKSGVSAQRYADVLLEVGAKTGLSPFILASIMDHESRSGDALAPKGEGGTGDRLNRWVTTDQLKNTYDFAQPRGLLTGRSAKPGERFPDDYARRLYGEINKSSETRYEIKPPAAGSATVAGWGYGLMQIDYATSGFRQWIDARHWKAPRENIEKGAAILQGKINAIKTLAPRYMQPYTVDGKQHESKLKAVPTGDDLMKAALAAYNRGEGGVLAKLRQGLPPDHGNPNGDYGVKRWKEAAAVASMFTDKAGSGTVV